jgi:hypothetical protein
MSALGHKRTRCCRRGMSASPPKADMPAGATPDRNHRVRRSFQCCRRFAAHLAARDGNEARRDVGQCARPKIEAARLAVILHRLSFGMPARLASIHALFLVRFDWLNESQTHTKIALETQLGSRDEFRHGDAYLVPRSARYTQRCSATNSIMPGS